MDRGNVRAMLRWQVHRLHLLVSCELPAVIRCVTGKTQMAASFKVKARDQSETRCLEAAPNPEIRQRSD